MNIYVRNLEAQTNRWLPEASVSTYFQGSMGIDPSTFTFSANSSTLIHPSEFAIAIVDLRSGKPIASLANAQDVTVSSDHHYAAYRVAFDRYFPRKKNIYLTHLASGETRLISRITTSPVFDRNILSNGRPYFSPDGKGVVFSSAITNLSGVPSAVFQQLYFYNVLTDHLQLISMSKYGDHGANQISGIARIASRSPTVFFASPANDLKALGQPSGFLDIYSVTLPDQTDLARDSDADNLPDWWENRYLGDLSRKGSDISPSGVSFQQVYEQNVALPGRIWINASLNNVTGALQITFPSTVGKSYRVEYTSDLSNPTWPTSTFPIIATDTTFTFLRAPQLDFQGQSTVYYRVVQVD